MELHDTTKPCVGAERNAADEQVGEWRPESDKLVVMGSLAILSFMVALDACVIVTSLDVGWFFPRLADTTDDAS